MRRIAEFDGLRGLAALWVVYYHLRGGWGFVAVDVFFVLSGYLITAIILRESGERGFLRAFYWRRGLRIWPIYYLLVLGAIVVSPPPPGLAGYYLTYTQNVPRLWHGWSEWMSWAPMEHTWTLALEEQFYLIWPFLVMLVGRRAVPAVALAIAMGSVATRFARVEEFTLVGRCDGFALGGLLAALMATPRWQRWVPPAAWLAASAASVAVAYIVVTGRSATNVAIVGANCGTFAVVAAALFPSGTRPLSFLRVRPLVYLGTISYGIYLYHWPILQLCVRSAGRMEVGGFPLDWIVVPALSVAVAAASWHFIERPILQLKERFAYRPSAVSPVQPRDGEMPSAENPLEEIAGLRTECRVRVDS